MSEPLGLAPRERWIYGALAALLTLLWLATLAARPLFNPDEGRYAEIPREMQSGGDWVVPHLNGLAYIEKPPLQYWATALSFRVLGPSEFAARLYTALTALGTILLVWLRHVAYNLIQSPGDARNWVWTSRNIETVLRLL